MLESEKLSKGHRKPLCFVIGPIGKDGSNERKHSDLLLNAVIKEVLKDGEFDYEVKRADEDADPGMIGDRVVTDIINAELVIADLTDLNPNAFYELGIRHSTEKPTIHVAKSGTLLPFDNIAHRTIFIDLTDWHSIEQARTRLAESARAVNVPGYKVSNPITQANASFKMRQSDDPRDRVIAGLQERMSSLENSLSKQSLDIEIAEDDFRPIPYELWHALNTGKKIEAIKTYRGEFSGSELKHAKDFIEAILDGKKIEAIKLHRMISGDNLRTSKNYVETLTEALSVGSAT